MNCSDFREALSARIDGETATLPDSVVDLHLAGCPQCRAWQDDAVRLRRVLLVREAPRVPDLTERILTEIPAPPAQRWGLRIALALVALGQSGLGFAELLGADVGHAGHGGMMAMAVHLGNESAAWNLAVGFGLLWAALRPATASGLLPALAGFVAVLGLMSGIDLFDGAVTVSRVLSHGLLVAGLGLLYGVRRQHRRTSTPGPSTRVGATTHDEVTLDWEPRAADGGRGRRRRFPHLPASRRRAA
ncbi:zf-HC2 domain-containing protein [Amycolatopsis sp., V23-08]|uniref:Zf-HC2 domain-containing protein n=1 Tax=Amycolatopsis heterodermiae TaxID=3110235 RepID=A0ABU5R9L8_9PSEU|nr:zf-HC2 domain-containing protein [Amycolatopsis sp., V23-08]MEA5362923.1 zf-HC2 domain-containing protein [Amycolatopsis sp., V23-08]